MNKYKKFIKEAYNGKLGLTMCQDWKQKIESEFPELLEPKKQELGPNKWYLNDSNCIFFFNGQYDRYDFPVGYGIDRHDSRHDRWRELDINDGWGKEGLRLATEEEVKEALIKEAKKRGFKEGVLHNTIQYETDKIIAKANIYGYNQHQNKLLFNNWCIFQNGKWCETFENTITRAEAEKQLNAKIID